MWIRTRDAIALVVGLLLIVMGSNGLRSIAYGYAPFRSRADWCFAMGVVIFGAMIFGVAINKISTANRLNGRKTKSTSKRKKNG